MLSPQSIFVTSIFLILTLQGCEKIAQPNDVKNYCDNLQLGLDYDEMVASLTNRGLEVRTRAPQADNLIVSLVEDSTVLDGVLITSKGLKHSQFVPACMIYFSSDLYAGNGKIVSKEFIIKEPKGIY